MSQIPDRSRLDGLISMEFSKLPESQRGCISIEKCAELARIVAIRYASEIPPPAKQSTPVQLRVVTSVASPSDQKLDNQD